MNLQNLLDELQIKAVRVQHSASGKTTTQASSALNEPPSRIIKSLLIKSKNGQFIGIIVRGDTRVDFKKIEQHFASVGQPQHKKFRMATPDEVETQLGYKIGGVPPFAFYKRFPALFDPKILEMNYVIGAGGNEFTGLKFDPKEIRKLGYIEKHCSFILPTQAEPQKPKTAHISRPKIKRPPHK